MATTFVQIGTTITVGAGGVGSVTFSSIPATFTDLKLVYSSRTTRGIYVEEILVEFNGSGGTAYSQRTLGTNGTISFSNSGSGLANMNTVAVTSTDGTTANTFGNGELYIPNYTSANNKSLSGDASSENNAVDAYAYLAAGLWADNAAITSIKLTPAIANNFVQYSSFSLYGIKST
jgi:hypothetical protein